MEDKKDILHKYTGKPYPALEKPKPAPELVKSDASYHAVVEFKRNNRSPRFRIVDIKGVSYGCSYAHLLDWIFTAPHLLILNTTTRIFTIEGKNLEMIEQLLMEERVKELHEFDPNRHNQPLKDEPLIEKVGITTQ